MAMKLVACLIYYNEHPSWLANTVASLTRAQVDHLIAIDGPYILYPGALRRPTSPFEQTEAIVATAHGHGMGLTLHLQQQPWQGNEVEKRNHMFVLARTLGLTTDDWLLVIDADEQILTCVGDFKQQLAAVTEDVAYVAHTEPTCSSGQIRKLFRWHPALRVEGTHFGYCLDMDARRNKETGIVTIRKTWLWDGHGTPTADLTAYLTIDHRYRTPGEQRHDDKWAYYRLRNELGVEKPVTA